LKNIPLTEKEYITKRNIAVFKRHKLNTVWDLLTYYPKRFNDYTIVSTSEAPLEQTITISGIVQGKPYVYNARSKLTVMNFYIDSDGNKVRVTIFNRHFLRSKLNYGVYVRVTGKFQKDLKNFTASEIELDEYSNNISPIFGIDGITDDKLFEIKQKLLREHRKDIKDYLPQSLKDKHDLIDLDKAIKFVNTPDTMNQVEKAIKRIKFEELLLYQLKIKYSLYMRKNHLEGLKINFDKEKVEQFIKDLPFELTKDQKEAVDKILGDLNSNYKMSRLLQGEVGSGKTVVAAIALCAAYTAGYQAAMLVPTEILANQHFDTLKAAFKNTDLSLKLLTASVPLQERREILKGLEKGNINIIVGTHSLFQKDVNFQNLGFVVTDEEHRFGVKQRAEMVAKGQKIDHLKMTATPIPRTLAISVMGDSDISTIKTMPGNKKPVITEYLQYKDKDKVMNHLKEEINRGRQIYIVCPAIEESESLDLKNVTNIYLEYKELFKDICDVGLIHSRLKQEEKEEVMKNFKDDKIKILISTSVIEVGVNIHNATTIVILDADRFGVAQLHQMRGRVRRSDYQAYCFLVSDTTVDTAIARLKLIASNSDGFTLAEEDLLVRGPGEYYGVKQSGIIDFQFANIINDRELLNLCNDEADRIIDSGLIFTEEYEMLYNIVDEDFKEKRELLE